MFSSKKRSGHSSKSAAQSLGTKGSVSYQAVVQRAMTEPGSLTAADVHILQRTVGNSATISLLSHSRSANSVSVQRAPGIFKRKKKEKTPEISEPQNATVSSGHDEVMQMLSMANPQELLALSQNSGFMQKVSQLPEDQFQQAQSFLRSLTISVPSSILGYFSQKYLQRTFQGQRVPVYLKNFFVDRTQLTGNGVSERVIVDYVAGNDNALASLGSLAQLYKGTLDSMRQQLQEFQQATMLPLDIEDIEMLLFQRRAEQPTPPKKTFGILDRLRPTADNSNA